MKAPKTIFRAGLLLGLALHLGVPEGDAWARGGRRAHTRPNVSRSGPASRGSLRNQAEQRGPDRRGSERDYDHNRYDRRDQYDREDRVERRVDRGRVDIDREDLRDRPNAPDSPEEAKRRQNRREHIRDERRDYYEDRRDFRRGAVYYSSWWSTSCTYAEVVETGGYTYYKCEGAWFSRTYYGGEVIYTVTDAPPGY